MEDLYNKLRLECHDRAFDCFGYAYIFRKRAKRYKFKITLLQAFGVLVPASVGAAALGYGTDWYYLKAMMAIAIPASTIQFILSLWSIIYKWDDKLAYAYDGIQSYTMLSDDFKKLGKFPPESYDLLRIKFDLADTSYSSRQQQDADQNIESWEERMGMRYSLRQFQKSCIGCNIVPLNLKSTDCPVCGNYSFKYQILVSS